MRGVFSAWCVFHVFVCVQCIVFLFIIAIYYFLLITFCLLLHFQFVLFCALFITSSSLIYLLVLSHSR